MRAILCPREQVQKGPGRSQIDRASVPAENICLFLVQTCHLLSYPQPGLHLYVISHDLPGQGRLSTKMPANPHPHAVLPRATENCSLTIFFSFCPPFLNPYCSASNLSFLCLCGRGQGGGRSVCLSLCVAYPKVEFIQFIIFRVDT